MKKQNSKVRSRNQGFTEKPETRIWYEQPSDQNPYLAEACFCHGYDLMELMQKRSFIDVFYLLFRGELPSKDESGLLEKLMIALINPGPRHAATRAAMNAGVGKTDNCHILPIALMTMGGNHLGAGEIEESMGFIRKHQKQSPEIIIDDLISNLTPNTADKHIAPGFGNRFGGIDPLPQKLALSLAQLPAAGKAIKWGCTLSELIKPYNMGWLNTGLAAAVFTDLGFQPRAGAGLFQLLTAPGLLAHGIEMANKPITAMPFIKDENYTIDYEQK